MATWPQTLERPALAPRVARRLVIVTAAALLTLSFFAAWAGHLRRMHTQLELTTAADVRRAGELAKFVGDTVPPEELRPRLDAAYATLRTRRASAPRAANVLSDVTDLNPELRLQRVGPSR